MFEPFLAPQDDVSYCSGEQEKNNHQERPLGMSVKKFISDRASSPDDSREYDVAPEVHQSKTRLIPNEINSEAVEAWYDWGKGERQIRQEAGEEHDEGTIPNRREYLHRRYSSARKSSASTPNTDLTSNTAASQTRRKQQKRASQTVRAVLALDEDMEDDWGTEPRRRLLDPTRLMCFAGVCKLGGVSSPQQRGVKSSDKTATGANVATPTSVVENKAFSTSAGRCLMPPAFARRYNVEDEDHWFVRIPAVESSEQSDSEGSTSPILAGTQAESPRRIAAKRKKRVMHMVFYDEVEEPPKQPSPEVARSTATTKSSSSCQELGRNSSKSSSSTMSEF